MAGAYPRPFKHVKDGHFPTVVVNFHRAANRSSQKPPRKSPRLAGEEAAVLMYDVEPDYWCLRCPYYESNTDRRCTKPDWILSSQKNDKQAANRWMQDSGIFFALFYVLNFHLKNVTIKRY